MIYLLCVCIGVILGVWAEQGDLVWGGKFVRIAVTAIMLLTLGALLGLGVWSQL